MEQRDHWKPKKAFFPAPPGSVADAAREVSESSLGPRSLRCVVHHGTYRRLLSGMIGMVECYDLLWRCGMLWLMIKLEQSPMRWIGTYWFAQRLTKQFKAVQSNMFFAVDAEVTPSLSVALDCSRLRSTSMPRAIVRQPSAGLQFDLCTLNQLT